jgi:hypothetical protein
LSFQLQRGLHGCVYAEVDTHPKHGVTKAKAREHTCTIMSPFLVSERGVFIYLYICTNNPERTRQEPGTVGAPGGRRESGFI